MPPCTYRGHWICIVAFTGESEGCKFGVKPPGLIDLAKVDEVFRRIYHYLTCSINLH